MRHNSKYSLFAFAMLLMLVCGCEYYGEVPEEYNVVQNGKLTSYRLTLLEEYGTKADPLIINDSQPINLKVEAIDALGQVIEGHTANLKFSATNTFIGRNGWQNLDITSGDTVTIDLKRGVGPIRIMAEDAVSYSVGASDIIYLPEPSMSTIQTPVGTGDASPWSSHFLHIELGKLIVTHVGLTGFYLTDADADAYNSIYVYTHGIPETDRGDRLKFISGTISEFYGLTEMSFPDYEVECHYDQLPEPVLLTSSMLSDNDEMEKYEGSLVTVENLTVYKVDETTYYNYGQWTGKTGDGGEITIISRDTVPELDPRTFNGTFSRMTGVLKQHYAANPDWMLMPRDECDVWGFGERPSFCDSEMPETTCE